MSSEQREKLRPSEKSVIFLVYEVEKDIVWLEERLEGNYKGYIIIPGGKMDLTDKRPEHAMIREADEEMGIKVKHFIALDSFVDMSLSGNLRRQFAYLVTAFDGLVENKEGKNRLFSVPIGEAKQYLELGSSRYILELAKKQLGV